ncbi:MAG: hypothetical protein AAB362_00780 [Patescibacteria group bacterium]
MSYGKKSDLFQPVIMDMLPEFKRLYPRAERYVDAIFNVLTAHCTVETLLFASVIDLLDRFERNKSSNIVLSVIRKDHRGKMQSENMELVHDVVVELQMAGDNFRKLQSYFYKHDRAMVFMHSCKVAIVALDEVDSYYQTVAKEQALRTMLDWTGVSEKNIQNARIIDEGVCGAESVCIIEKIVLATNTAIQMSCKCCSPLLALAR